MSLALSRASPTPCHKGLSWLVTTHANLLRWSFWSKASLTIAICCLLCCRLHSWWTCCSFWIRPKRGHCHGCRVLLSCWVREWKCSTGGFGNVSSSGLTIGRSILWWYLSDGVTGLPRNGWLVGIVGKNETNLWLDWVWIATLVGGPLTAWCNRLPSGEICHVQNLRSG